MFQAPLSQIHRAVCSPLPLACCAPPASEGMGCQRSVTPETAAMRSSTRFTWGSRISRSGTSGERMIAAWSCISGRLSTTSVDGAVCISIASAMASTGQVSNSVPGNSESPCSSDVFIRMKRTKSTLPASMEMFGLWRRARSEALPNRYHSRQISAASW
ncbi:Hypothetical protein PHPALM_8853 [Phytophthora palmivora]|uniref:Uncharacterized protein n=1 Tax=Phytophthora palmivora TaxID=4796 RepID=A0A2P4Y8V1_9STRA|nr:Hypothetical protein PHPALM_8853 [Phytophthora palmivora]